MTQYKRWPGQSKADFDRCLKCRWHGVLSDHICCDYSQIESHGARMCPVGVNCTKFEPRGKPKSEAQVHRLRGIEVTQEKRNTRTRKADMVPYTKKAHKRLLERMTIQQIADVGGATRFTINDASRRGRIRREVAERILEQTGIDVRGGDRDV